jgi:RNA polymerase sigma-B factor
MDPVLIRATSLVEPNAETLGNLPLERAPDDALWRVRHENSLARDELVRRHLPLARRLALRYQSAHESLDDLVQVANVGLIGAVNRFEPDRGASFISYATPTILGELKRHFRDTGWSVHVPRGTKDLALKVQQGATALTDRHGRSPEVSELADYLELSVEQVLDGLESAQAHYSDSLDAPLGEVDPEAQTLADRLGSVDAGYDLVDTTSALSRGIGGLPYLEREALTLRIRDDLKQSDIAQLMGCSQMQVSRLLRRAADRLRTQLDGV